MEGHCDICADIGVADALHTCTQCKINTEHMYCMRNALEEPVDHWRCEECESSSKSKPVASCLLGELHGTSKTNSLEAHNGRELNAESRNLPNESRVGSHNWEKVVATGKTKYICVKEAIMLSSGEKNSSAPFNIPCHSKPIRPKFGKNKSGRAAMRPRTLPISFFSQQDLASRSSRQPKPLRVSSSQQDLASMLSRPPKPQRLGNVEVCERQLQQFSKLTEVLRSESGLQPSEAPKNKHMQKEQPRDIQWAGKKARRLVKKQSSTPSLTASPVTISGGNSHAIELRIGDAQNVNNNVLPDLEKSSCVPASSALWKGSFSIQGDHIHGELDHQIQAYPPSRVRRKIYEFSKKMPEVLHFQLVPARTFWVNLFECIPDERDIALYFFPSVGERLEDYVCLLGSISLKNLALRLQIADVELLVFTSKLLPVDCQCWEGKNFLWGVFHRLKRDTMACLDNRALALPVQPSNDASHAHDQVDDMEEVDMDIDMIGGINVGRIDVPAQKESLRGIHTSVREEPTAAVDLPVSEQPITSASKQFVNPVATFPLLNVKMEFCDLIPPGFEEVFKLRMQGSLSSVEKIGGQEGQRR